MQSIRYCSFFLLSIISFAAKSQTDSLQAAERYYKEGMESFNNASRKKATALFLRAIKANPRLAKAHLMAGKSIMMTINKKHSLKYFRDAYAIDSGVDEDILFLIGQAYHYAEEFDSALLYYDRFNKLLNKSMMFERSLKVNEVNRKIFECRNAMIYKANPVNVAIEDLSESINSEYADYAPNISADESVLVFTTRRPDKTNNESLADDLEPYEEIYMAKKVDGKWQPAQNIGGPLNSAFHNANVSLSPDAKEMFVYKDENGGDLYESVYKSDGTWSKPDRMNGFINSPYLENSAAVTSDDQKLFFVSDRPGGYGGTDIYVAFKNKRGEWGDVQNLGPVVNSNRDEEDVFIAENGKQIYFSSDGHAGMGDLDIYRASFDSAKMQWAEPLNLGYPVNSMENDIYFVLSGDERYAYISSVRDNTKGDQDIYRIDLLNWVPMTRQELIARELKANNLLQPATPESRPPSANGNSITKMADAITLSIETVDENGGLVDATLKLTDNQSKEIPLIKTGAGSYTASIQNQTDSKFIALAEAPGFIQARSTLLLVGQSQRTALKESLVLKKSLAEQQILSLYYKTNQAEVTNPDDLEIVKTLLKENPNVKIQIDGYTDNDGDAQYNLQLSRARADNIKKILVQSGIAASRITTNGFGASRPITDNTTGAGRKLNRRTTFTILSK